MVVLNQTSVPWAQDEDWAQYRTIITELYMSQKRKLDDVRRIMAEDYGFYATLRMYKTRFKKWGLAKNKRPKPLCLKDSNPNSPYIPAEDAGRSLETSQRSKKPIASKRSRRITDHSSTLTHKHLWAQPMARSMAPPDFYKFAEDVSHSTLVYIRSVRSPTPELPSSSKTIAWPWLNYITTAGTLFSLGHPRRALLLVDICCQRYRSLLGSQDLSLLETTIVAILKFMRYGPGLVEAFIDFACNMSQIVLGIAHPLSLLFQKWKAAGSGQLAYCIGTAIQYCQGEYCLGGVANVVSHPMMESYGDMYSEMIYHKIFRPTIMLSELQLFQTYLQDHVQREPGSQSLLLERVQGLQCRVAWLHFYAGYYEEATKVVFEMLSEPRADTRVITGCYDLLYDIAVAENKHEMALEMIRKAVAASVEAYGYAHCTTARKMARLESYLRSKGHVQEADKVRRDSEMQLEQICEEIRHSQF
ncbi:Clr5 domain-containing protein [Xylaria digitata]|nr:Clr5 domain-containing protein [Xylaria digitata]